MNRREITLNCSCTILRITAALLVTLLPMRACWAMGDVADSGSGEAPPTFVELTPELNLSVEKGLAALATLQTPDGSFGGPRYPKHVGITSLACLAFMADGHVPGRGKYALQVERGLEFVLQSAQETGLLSADNAHGPMYGHGFATLFLGEVYGMSSGSASQSDPRVREVLVKAVRLIVNTQNREGGWRYHPVAFDADISVTICQIMALRSARNAGLSVPKATIDRAIAYVRQCQNPDRKSTRLNSSHSSVSRMPSSA